jgi:hypothetical protein
MDENKHPSFLIWHFMDEHFVPYFMDEKKHTNFLILQFMDELLCPILWMKKSTPPFSFCILWMSICAYFFG